MLDSFERYAVDTTSLARALENLPGSYDGPRRVLDAPHGVVGFGEGAWPAEVARSWIDAAIVSTGTQFVLAGGLDFGEADAAALLAQAAGSTVHRIGFPPPSISVRDEDEPDLDAGVNHLVPPSPLSAYTYLQALAHATGRADRAALADDALAALRDSCQTSTATDANPAKRLAWSLWTRTPILLATRGHAEQVWAWHAHLARIGKSMSVPVERDALIVLSGGFEARHESGDERVALLLGGQDEALTLAREVLETRVDDVISVDAPPGDAYAATLHLWYLGAWTAYYLALLYNADPKDSPVLERLRRA